TARTRGRAGWWPRTRAPIPTMRRISSRPTSGSTAGPPARRKPRSTWSKTTTPTSAPATDRGIGLGEVRMLPVAELHVHIEGTLEPELLVKLAARNGTPMPILDAAELRATYHFGDLPSFLGLYYANLRVLKIEADFYDLANAYLTRAAAAGVRRAEIFFDPQTHLANGVRLEEVFGGLTAALADGARDHGISADLIVCFLRDLGADAAEEGGPDYVREALDELHVERIDHGVRSMEDPELVARLRAEQIPLTVCP